MIPATATIYKLVNGKMQPLQQVASGQVLKIANQEKSGWYACAVPNTNPAVKGWVRASDVAVTSEKSAYSRSAESSGRSGDKRWSVGVVYDAAIVSPTQLQAASGLAPNPSLASTLGLEAEKSFFMDPLYFGVRVDVLLLSGKLPDGNPEGGDLGYSGFALPITGVVRYDLISGQGFRLGVRTGVGISPLTTYRVSIGDTTTSASGLTLFLPGEIEADIRIGSRLLLLIEAGYRFVAPISAITVSGIAMSSDFSSFFGGGGLRVEL